MERDIFEPEHLAFRDTVRQFLARHVLPHHASWERAGMVERWVWKAAAEQGLLGLQAEEAYGGGGVDDFRFNVILDEEVARSGATGLTFGLQNDIVGPYFYSVATPGQKQRWLPGVCRGETILAIAMSEPDAGSDLQGIKTTAVRDGDHYVLNGTKRYITNAPEAGVFTVMARTDPLDKPSGEVWLRAENRSLAPKRYLLHEWHYGPYERLVELPAGFEGDASAHFGNGQIALRIERGGNRTDAVIVLPGSG